MAPTKNGHSILGAITSRNPISTRSRTISNYGTLKDITRGKRKADGSPSKENAVKRSAFGDMTNAVTKGKQIENKVQKSKAVKKVTVQAKVLPSVKTVLKPKQNENLPPPQAPANKIVTRAATKHILVPNQTALKPKENKENVNITKVNKRLSNEFEKTEESLYSTALEDSNDSTYFSAKKNTDPSTSHNEANSASEKPSNLSLVTYEMETKLNLGNHNVPDNVPDYDKENWDDVFQVSHYAMDVFNYLKDREDKFVIPDYMDRQICLTRSMRALLVDWMVEIQESFELNHETLYLGVKLVDMYLSKMTVGKETLQLVGAAAMFISCKYDERMPPMVDDFLYICDGAYKRRELIRMELNLLKVCNFDLGIPISYRFLRRYARCAKITMPVLTLARYILEFSLMDYSTVTIRDSIVASAALYIALRMKNISQWTPTLEFYTGYKQSEIHSTAILLNSGLHKPSNSQLMTVKNKYSHKIFFEVAKTPLLRNEDL